MMTDSLTRPRLNCLLAILVALAAAPLSAQDKPANPLGELFRKLDRGIRGEADQPEESKFNRDQIDLRLPQRPEDQRRLKQADDLLKAERWHEAIEVLQFLIEQPADAFSFNNSGDVASLHEIVLDRIGRLPEGGRRNYVNRFAAVAQALLVDAVRDQNEEQLLEVVTKYFHTPAGKEALEILAKLWEDRGELVSSARAWQRLAAAEPPTEQGRLAGEKAALLWARTGNPRAARRLAAELGVASPAFLKQLETSAPGAETPVADLPPYVPSPRILRVEEDLEPLLIPRWSVGTAERFSVQDQIRTLLRDLEDQQRAIVTALQPLAVNGRLAFRTLRGLQVRDIVSGELLWERPLERQPETLLTPARADDSAGEITPYSGAMFEHHPLSSLLFRDSVYGTLTSDGRHLFAVEPLQPLSSQGFGFAWQRMNRGSEADQETRSTNELAAYDFATGLPRWRLGGPRIEDRFSRTLAGTWFSGSPVSDGDDLFVVGEQAGEMLLFCLSARTGDVNWSQHLCTPGRPIDEDPVRRFWTCLPVIEQGLVICPTTCGWLIAVERRTRQLRWAYRFAPRIERQGRFRGGFAVQTFQEINRRWAATRPVVSGSRLLVMPPELPDEFGFSEPLLVCLDIATGRELWKQPKGDSLYLAGVVDDRAILVGKSSIQARQVSADGNVDWQIPLTQTDQFPSGRAALADGKLYLPMGLRTLLTIDLELREIVQRATLPSAAVHLGNLHVQDGMLISTSPLDIAAFPAGRGDDRLAAEREHDLPLKIRRVELLTANREFLQAYELLEEIIGSPRFGDLSEPQRQQMREQEWHCLVAMMNAQLQDRVPSATQPRQPAPPDPHPWMERLKVMATTPDQQLTFRRLFAESKRIAGDWRSALREYRTLLTDSPPDLLVPDGGRQVRIDGWIGARLHRLHETLTEDQRAEFDNELQQWFNSLPGRSAVARALSFHRLGQAFELSLARAAADAGRFGEAILRWQRVAEGPDDELAALGREAFAELIETRELPIDDAASPRPANWGRRWEAVPAGGGHQRDGVSTVAATGEPLAFLRDTRFLYDMQHHRLRIENARSAELIWSLPLRSFRAMEHHPSVGIRWSGPLALAMHRGVLHALRFPEREIAWSFTPQVDGLSAARLRTPTRSSRHAMQSVGSYVNSNRLGAQRSPNGYLLAANPFAVLVLAREFTALDPLTGEVLWRDAEMPIRTTAHVYGPDFLTYSAQNAQIVSHLDGAASSPAWLARQAADAIGIHGRDLILLTEANGDRLLKRESTETGRTLWSHKIDRQALAGQPDADSFCWLTPAGQLYALDLNTGEETLLGGLPEALSAAKRQVSILSDADRFYLVVDTGNAQISYVNMPSIRTAGAVLGFDRDGGNSWHREIDALWQEPGSPAAGQQQEQEQQKRWSLNLLLDGFDENPLLLLIGDRPEQRGDIYFRRLRLIGLDKATGEPLIRWGRPSDSNGFKYLHVDLADRSIELRTYTSRLQLRPVDDPE